MNADQLITELSGLPRKDVEKVFKAAKKLLGEVEASDIDRDLRDFYNVIKFITESTLMLPRIEVLRKSRKGQFDKLTDAAVSLREFYMELKSEKSELSKKTPTITFIEFTMTMTHMVMRYIRNQDLTPTLPLLLSMFINDIRPIVGSGFPGYGKSHLAKILLVPRTSRKTGPSKTGKQKRNQ